MEFSKTYYRRGLLDKNNGINEKRQLGKNLNFTIISSKF